MLIKTWLQLLFVCACIVHVLLSIASGIVWYLQERDEQPSSYIYSFYRPKLVGERISLLDATDFGKLDDGRRNASTTFSEDIQKAYAKVCIPKQGSNRDTLLMLTGSSGADMTELQNYTQTWMPTKYPLVGVSEVNGYGLLTGMFIISFLFQSVFCWHAFKDEDTSFFAEPCLERWLEYVCTSPLQVVLIASLLMIRDVYTLSLLLAAQTVCVLLGFAVECAMENGTAYKAMSFHGTSNHRPGARPQAMRLWWVCFVCSAVLHCVIWYILIFQLLSIEAETQCYVQPAGGANHDQWIVPLRAVVWSQFVLFTLFAMVPPTQKVYVWGVGGDAGDTLLYGSVAYGVLSVAAKFTLGVSYICFVRLFPFSSKA
jgi:hypothetical protein